MRSHSTFWLGERNFARLGDRNELSPMELVKYQRSIGNFVRILTKESIPVTFRVQGDSYTDGEKVIISSNITQSNFDSVVGLALHEGSHIVLSDFSILHNFYNRIRSIITKSDTINSVDEADEWENKVVNDREYFQNIWNIVEDRRCDYYVYTNSPGYKPYYEAMYDRFFNDRIIDKALKTDKYTEVNKKSYKFRICNFTNPNTRLNALPDLDKMYNLIFDDIASIDSSEKSMVVAFEIYKMIIENVEKAEAEKEEKEEESNQNDSEQQEESSSNSSSEQSSESDGVDTSVDGQGDDIEDSETDSDESDETGDDEGSDEAEAEEASGAGSNDDTESDEDESDEDETSGGSSQSEEEDESDEADESEGSEESEDEDETPELTDRQDELIEELIEKQEKFLNGENTQKRTLTKTTRDLVDNLADIDSESEEVEFNTSDINKAKTQVLTIHGFDNKIFNILGWEYHKSSIDEGYRSGLTDVVKEGILLGKRLGKKLQIRNRERTTTYNRKRKGKLDKRRIHALGFGNESVFNQFVTERHEDAFIHLSIDGSTSMTSGGAFDNSIKSAVAMAQMAEMTNIDIQISLRITQMWNDIRRPIMWVVYDSRKDSMKTVKKYFKYLKVSGITPEGLCFDAIVDELPVGSDALKTYFINYSDGEPNFSEKYSWDAPSYHGRFACEHTASQVKKMKKKGYQILSFFLGSEYSTSNFKTMYGSDASFIDPTELTELVKELQEMFTEN